MIYGDFYARPTDFVDELEQRLISIVEELFTRPDFECAGIPPQEFARPILEACQEILGVY